MARKPLKLSDDLERAILAAILSQRAEPDAVRPEEVSKTGRAVLAAVHSLEKPSFDGVLLHLTEVQGLPREGVADYLAALKKINSEGNAAEVLQAVRDKQTIVELINAAQDMLGSKKGLDVGLLSGFLDRSGSAGGASFPSASERIKDGFPDPPAGLRLRSLPSLYEKTGGLYGSWVIGGEPKLGKTALSWQVALDVSSTNDLPVLYYDLENSFNVMVDHTRKIYKGDHAKARKALSKIYHRDSIRTLEADLSRVGAPALVVVDHIQRLPASVEFKKASLDRWIHRLDSLKKRGFTVLMISEINRASYNSDAYMGAYKESGEIEYAAETGIQLLRGPGETVEVHVVANRHRPFRGLASLVQRYNDWAFKEVGAEAEERVID